MSLVDSSSNQQLTNGGFEISSNGWWIGSDGSCSGMSPSSSINKPYHGSRSFRDRCTTSTVWVAQAFNATAGVTYTLSFWTYLLYNYTGSTSDMWMNVLMN